ncbi:MAG TPA: hypothetical protein VFM05_15130, partial [Candidatus Saccharimonadales bacterium]|nr:hypothetical protein [Candidatus Saccharimonadales bacterium]
STCFASRGSGVRVPVAPPKKTELKRAPFSFSIDKPPKNGQVVEPNLDRIRSNSVANLSSFFALQPLYELILLANALSLDRES